ncbi:hypothetical protein C8F01DRAFT_376537 [Mycena amicta]|nr:hypothetical protein C8F01DRAFT_376537 [Mycena amicta]
MLREQYCTQHMPGYMATVAAGRASVAKKTKQQHVKKEEGVLGAGKENTGDLIVTAKAARVKWNATRYLKAARIVNVQQPWLAPHGKKAGAWDDCAALFNNQNGLSVTGHLFRMKMEGIIGWKKNPNGKFKALGSVVASGTGDVIMLGAQMEAMETQFDQAKDKSDDVKKNDEDKSGGDEIHRASMQGLRKRAISISSDETDTETDTDIISADKLTVTVPANTDTALANDTTVSTDEGTVSKGVPAPINITTDDDEIKDTAETKRKASKKPKSKRRRVMERGSTSDELIDIFKAENQHRAAHDTHRNIVGGICE